MQEDLFVKKLLERQTDVLSSNVFPYKSYCISKILTATKLYISMLQDATELTLGSSTYFFPALSISGIHSCARY